MKPDPTYLNEGALLDRVPTLAPGSWAGAESLSAEDNALLEHVPSGAPLADIASAIGLDPGAVIGSALRLHALGILAFSEGEPFYDEEAILAAVPRFDPRLTNRQAALDDPDRLLLAVLDGRTDLGTLCQFVPLPRERVVSSILRLCRTQVIDLKPPEGPARPAERPRPSRQAVPHASPEPGGPSNEPPAAGAGLGPVGTPGRTPESAPTSPAPPAAPVRVTWLDDPSRAKGHDSVRRAPEGPPLDAEHPTPSAPPPTPRHPPPGSDRAGARARTGTHAPEGAPDSPGSSPRAPAPPPPVHAVPPPIIPKEPTLEAKAARLLAQIKGLSDTEIEKQAALRASESSQSARERKVPSGRHPRLDPSAAEARGASRPPRVGTGSFHRVSGTSVEPVAAGKAKPRSFSLVFRFDAAEIAKFVLLALILVGGYHLVRAIYGGGAGPGTGRTKPIAVEQLKAYLPVIEAYPSEDRFQARVSSEWDAMDKTARKGKLLKMLLPVLQAGYTSVYLYDQSGALVATWAGGDLTLTDRDGSPGGG